MVRRSPLTVGPHVYSAEDARRTVAALPQLWSHHLWDSSIGEGWMAGARGFVAEIASLAGVPLPSLDDVATAISTVSGSIAARWDATDDERIGAVIAAMWRFFPTMRALDVDRSATVVGLHASRGLPKAPLERAEVEWTGLTGDVRRSRSLHGRPWQALCLWSADALASLVADGHPLVPGAVGENILLAGVDWRAMRPGTHLRIGAVRAVVTAYTLPCANIAPFFSDGDPSRLHHEKGDASRVYALVQRTGPVAVGDGVEIFTDR